MRQMDLTNSTVQRIRRLRGIPGRATNNTCRIVDVTHVGTAGHTLLTAAADGGRMPLMGIWTCHAAEASERNGGTWLPSVPLIQRWDRRRRAMGVTSRCSATSSARRAPDALLGTTKSA